jgi:hypothetical protein
MGFRRGDPYGLANSYEPIDALDQARMNPQVRVFVVASPTDRIVRWPQQTILADRLKEIGVPAFVLPAEGDGPAHHGLASTARIVAGACARGDSSDAIRALAGPVRG